MDAGIRGRIGPRPRTLAAFLACCFTAVLTPSAPAAGAAPVAEADFAVAHRDTRALISVLANDTDPDEDPLTAVLVDPSSPGSVLDLAPDGSFEYEPPEGFEGTDSFTYRAFDGTEYSNVAVVEIDVAPAAAGFGIHFDATAFVHELLALGCATVHEGFEDDAAWGGARSPATVSKFPRPSRSIFRSRSLLFCAAIHVSP